jgi:hypothetical protein
MRALERSEEERRDAFHGADKSGEFGQNFDEQFT